MNRARHCGPDRELMLKRWLDRNAVFIFLGSAIFPLTGRKVSSPWYTPYKFSEIKRLLEQPFEPSQLPCPYGRWLDERIIELPWLLSQVPEGPGTLLDAGSALNYDFILRHPKLRQKDLTIMTLAPEAECFWRRQISYVFGDLRQTAFRDNCFDYIASVSTIEHIGLDNTRFYTADTAKAENDPETHLAAISEFRRILKPGGSLFLTVPFGRHSVRDWLQVFDGDRIDRIITTFRPSLHSETYFRWSEPDGWRLSSRAESADARYFDHRSEPAWPGAPAAAGAVACLILTK
jgi:SAM-dependent methyltransferase